MRKMYAVNSEIISGEAGKLKYTAYCPIIEKPEKGAIRTINNFSRHACGEFVKYAMVMGEKIQEESSIARCYQLMYASRFIISFKYEMHLFDENLKPYNNITGAVWNVSDGSGVHVKEFFRWNVRYKEMILYVLSGKIKEKIAAGEKFYTEWHSNLYSAWQNMGYYICPEGFVFLIPAGVLKEETRTREVLVTFSELKNQLGGPLLT